MKIYNSQDNPHSSPEFHYRINVKTAEELGQVCAELLKAGIGFDSYPREDEGFIIALTGGY